MDFEFRNVKVYQGAKAFHSAIQTVIEQKKPGRIMQDQLSRASLSVALNIAEGYGRFHKADKRNFYVMARASLNESVACLDIIFDSEVPSTLMASAVELGKMLSGLIKTFST